MNTWLDKNSQKAVSLDKAEAAKASRHKMFACEEMLNSKIAEYLLSCALHRDGIAGLENIAFEEKIQKCYQAGIFDKISKHALDALRLSRNRIHQPRVDSTGKDIFTVELVNLSAAGLKNLEAVLQERYTSLLPPTEKVWIIWNTQSYEIKKSRFTIGRETKNDLQIPCGEVSGSHIEMGAIQ